MPGVALDALLSDVQLLGLDLDHFEVKGQLHSAPIIAYTYSKREARKTENFYSKTAIQSYRKTSISSLWTKYNFSALALFKVFFDFGPF